MFTRVSEDWAIDGTSLQGYVSVAPCDLEGAFGKADIGDQYKVSGQFIFRRNADGKVFTLYDWKVTSLYGGGPKPVAFWASSEPYDFHIGAHDKNGLDEFIQFVRDKVGKPKAAPKASNTFLEM